VEGQNLVIETRYAAGSAEELPALAAELVRLQVEVIVASGTAPIRAAQHATPTIPIVMASTYDPVGAGFVASLARPGGNITGQSWLGAELPGKRLELLKALVPQLSRLAVLANPANPAHEPLLHNVTGATRVLGLQLQVVELRRPEELDAAFAAMTREGADALLVLEEPLLLTGLRGRMAELAVKHRLPTMFTWKMSVEAGGLMSYGPSLLEAHQRAAI
jgi:putative ABC transport system substrate-binding protein